MILHYYLKLDLIMIVAQHGPDTDRCRNIPAKLGTGIAEMKEIVKAGQRGGEGKQCPDQARQDKLDKHICSQVSRQTTPEQTETEIYVDIHIGTYQSCVFRHHLDTRPYVHSCISLCKRLLYRSQVEVGPGNFSHPTF